MSGDDFDAFREIDRAYERGIRHERERILALARAHNYGPTLRTFAKWIARGKHEETTAPGTDGG